MRPSPVLIDFLLAAASVQPGAQIAVNPSYDVSSVRPSPVSSSGQADLDIVNGTLVCRGIRLRSLLQSAFAVPGDLIFNLPDWAATSRFDITAKDTTTTPAQLSKLSEASIQTMVRGLLQERFGLKSHAEMREVPAYELVTINPSPSLKQVPMRVGQLSIHNRHLEAKGIVLGQLLDIFSNELHRPVVDHTGLGGFYDVDLRWRRDDEASEAMAAHQPDAPPVLLTAVKEQLGLAFRNKKELVQVIVIDQLTRPLAD